MAPANVGELLLPERGQGKDPGGTIEALKKTDELLG